MILNRSERAERSLHQWCQRLWQTHEGRSRHPRYANIWPTRETFRAHWPLLAEDLIESDWQVREAQAGRTTGAVAYEILDPPETEHMDWRQLYAAELEQHGRIAWALGDRNPVASVLRLAGCTIAERHVARFWLAGNDAGDSASLSSLARLSGEQKRTVAVLLQRTKARLRLLGQNPLRLARSA